MQKRIAARSVFLTAASRVFWINRKDYAVLLDGEAGQICETELRAVGDGAATSCDRPWHHVRRRFRAHIYILPWYPPSTPLAAPERNATIIVRAECRLARVITSD